MPITYPHFGSITYVFEILLRELGRKDIIKPNNPNKKTVYLGSLYSPEFICTPFKVMLGTFIESLEKGATELIFGAGSHGLCRLSSYWPLFKLILEDLGFNFKFDIFDFDDPIKTIKDLKKISNGYNIAQIIVALRISIIKHRLIDIVDDLLREYRALEINRGQSEFIAENAYQKIIETKGIKAVYKLKKDIIKMFQELEIAKDTNPLKIAIIGEIYVVHETVLNLNIYKRLNELKVICKTPNTVRKLSDIPNKINPFKKMEYKFARKEVKPFLPFSCGGCAQDSIGDVILYKKFGWDGLIHLYPFTCMPEIISRNIIPKISKIYDIPVLSLIVDEQTGESGFQTRLEAFVDLLYRKRNLR